jgi:hypothetical protein
MEVFLGPEMTTGTVPKGQLMRGIGALLGFLAGLCAMFALVVTVTQAWQQRAQARWPEATARVDRCGLEQTSSGRRETYYIHCRLSYAVGGEQIVTNVYSGNVPSPEIWQLPTPPDWAVRRVGRRASAGDANRGALRSREP